MVAFWRTLCLWTVVGATAMFVERAASGLQKDLQQIDSDTQKLTAAFNAYDGSTASALAVLNAENNLDNDFKQTTKDAQATSPLSASDSQAGASYFTNPIEPDVRKLVTAMVSKRAAWSTYGDICDTCKKYRQDFRDLCNIFISLSASSSQAAYSSTCNKIYSDFSSCCA